MALGKPGRAESLLIYGTLVAGAIVFAFPFLWMTATSVKVQREMLVDRLRVFPSTPQPQTVTPYIDRTEFPKPQRPEGIPPAVWRDLEPRLETLLGGMVDAWQPRTPNSAATSTLPARVDPLAYREQMIRGLVAQLGGKISDKARIRAEEVERERRAAEKQDNASLSREALVNSLSPEAVSAGTEAVLAEVRLAVDDELLRQVFDAVYRRIALGDVRIRTRDFRLHSLFTGNEWRVLQGGATLAPVREIGLPSQEVRVRYTEQKPEIAFGFTPPASVLKPEGKAPLNTNDIDRIFVAYRGDASWAAVVFEVIRHGQLYRTKAMENLNDSVWVEQQLRWPEDDEKDAPRRPYRVLYPAGPAPQGSHDFEVRVRVRKIGLLAAWEAKLTRNYRLVFQEVPYGRYLATSFALTLLNILLAVFSCTLVAYAFARLKWPGRDFCFVLLLATMMIPPQVTMIPNFLVIRWLGWYNTLRPLWLPAAFGAPFFIFLLRQFLKNVPADLEDAARIDGCGFLRIYWHVMLPLVKPTIAVIAIYTFMGVWNNFMGPLIYVNDDRLFPLALGMFKFQVRSGSDIGLMMAGSFLMTLPILILFFFLQRYFIQGVSLTGIKG